jgi:hypothetical protein
VPARRPTIAETALTEIREHGPRPLDDLVSVVVAAGRTRARDPRRAVTAALDASPDVIRAWDGRWCSLVDQLEGAIFTARTTRFERANEIVLVRDHLSIVERLALRPRPFAAGGDVHLDAFHDFFDLPWMDDLDDKDLRGRLGPALVDDLLGFLREVGMTADADEDEALADLLWGMDLTNILHGPPGWLPPLGPRQLLGIRVLAGAIETVPLDRREVTGLHVGLAGARVARLAHLVIGPDASWFGPPAIALEELLELVVTEAPELLRRPLPPFAEVVTRGGLEVRDGWVGHPGTDWEATGLLEPLDPEDAWGFEPPAVIH